MLIIYTKYDSKYINLIGKYIEINGIKLDLLLDELKIKINEINYTKQSLI